MHSWLSGRLYGAVQELLLETSLVRKDGNMSSRQGGAGFIPDILHLCKVMWGGVPSSLTLLCDNAVGYAGFGSIDYIN